MPEIANRPRIEAGATQSLSALFTAQQRRVIQFGRQRIPEGEWQRQERELAALLLLLLDEVFIAGAEGVLSRGSLSGLATIDERTISAASGKWSERIANDLAARGVRNTRTYLNDGGSLEVAYGRERAESLSVTEITRARVAGEREVLAELERQGRIALAGSGLAAAALGTVTTYWRTEKDAKVCPICRPLDGTDQFRWEQDFPFGPPAHPRCRCELDYQLEGAI